MSKMRTTQDGSESWPSVGQRRNLGAQVHHRAAMMSWEGAVFFILAGVEEKGKKKTIKDACWLPTHLPALFSSSQPNPD